MPTALVTGATGFTGGALAARLVRDGYKVTAFARRSSNVDVLESLGVEIRRVNITDAADVASNMQSFDRVFHLAGSYREEHADKEIFRRVNVDATRHLLEAAGKHGVGRFVHCSAVGVQGAIEAPPANEDYRLRPGDHYQESKLEGEQLAQDFFRKGLPGRSDSTLTASSTSVGIFLHGFTRQSSCVGPKRIWPWYHAARPLGLRQRVACS